ncbi:translation initiation factor IF-2-like [Panthera uncia]|uniref:translation initiation factor IF-2-like n=1 Tax=Panthera uncia TaxID=29064 RepID=UPI0020FFCBFC|nr:translation initiation factor IF-2-like [Panthera uncia]
MVTFQVEDQPERWYRVGVEETLHWVVHIKHDESNLGQASYPPRASVSRSIKQGRSPGRRCGLKFPRPGMPRVPASPQPGRPAALSPAPARAPGCRQPAGPEAERGSRGGPPGPLPRPPGGPRRRSRPLTRGGRVLGKAGPGRGPPLPPAPPCRPGSAQSPGARSEGAAPAGAHTLERGGREGGRRAPGSASRALACGCGAPLAPAPPLTHGSGDTRRR